MLWLGQLERQYLADRQAFGVAALLKDNSEAVPPSWDERQAEFDRLLLSDPEAAEDDLLARLGIAA